MASLSRGRGRNRRKQEVPAKIDSGNEAEGTEAAESKATIQSHAGTRSGKTITTKEVGSDSNLIKPSSKPEICNDEVGETRKKRSALDILGIGMQSKPVLLSKIPKITQRIEAPWESEYNRGGTETSKPRPNATIPAPVTTGRNPPPKIDGPRGAAGELNRGIQKEEPNREEIIGHLIAAERQINSLHVRLTKATEQEQANMRMMAKLCRDLLIQFNVDIDDEIVLRAATSAGCWEELKRLVKEKYKRNDEELNDLKSNLQAQKRKVSDLQLALDQIRNILVNAGTNGEREYDNISNDGGSEDRNGNHKVLLPSPPTVSTEPNRYNGRSGIYSGGGGDRYNGWSGYNSNGAPNHGHWSARRPRGSAARRPFNSRGRGGGSFGRSTEHVDNNGGNMSSWKRPRVSYEDFDDPGNACGW